MRLTHISPNSGPRIVDVPTAAVEVVERRDYAEEQPPRYHFGFDACDHEGHAWGWDERTGKTLCWNCREPVGEDEA